MLCVLYYFYSDVAQWDNVSAGAVVIGVVVEDAAAHEFIVAEEGEEGETITIVAEATIKPTAKQ